jgi:hypothetical protein
MLKAAQELNDKQVRIWGYNLAFRLMSLFMEMMLEYRSRLKRSRNTLESTKLLLLKPLSY